MRADVGGHNDNRIFEVGHAPFVVGQAAVVEYLQQNIEYVGVGFFDLVQQNYAVGFSAHGFGQLAAFVVAHVARRGTNQAAHGMAFLVLAHVDADQGVVVVEQKFGQCFGQFGFSYARCTQKNKRTDRPFGVLHTGTASAHGIGHHPNRFLLTGHPLAQFSFQKEQLVAF